MGPTPLLLTLLVAFLLPFERLGAFAVGGINVRPSQLALAALWLVLLRRFLRREAAPDWRRPELLALAAFLAAAAVSTMNAENFRRSFLVWGFTAFTASLAFVLPAVLRAAGAIARVRRVILFSSALVGLFGLWQFLGDMAGLPAWLTGLRPHYAKAVLGFTRIQSAAAEPLYFADYLLLPISLAAAWLFHTDDRKTALRLSALLGLLVLDLLLTSSRGGYAGLAAAGLALLWLCRKRLASARRLLAVAGIGLGAAALALVLLAAFFTTSRETMTALFFRHVTTVTDGAAYDERAETFGKAVEAFLMQPWIGVGVGGYGPFVAAFPLVKPDAGWAIVNNEPLELLAETGVIGFAAFVVFLVMVFLQAKTPDARASDAASSDAKAAGDDAGAVRIGAFAALVGMLVQYQTFSTLYVMHVWFTIGLLLAASRPRGRP